MREHNPLYLDAVGDGEPLVLLHGWGMHSGIWDDFADKLAVDYKVIKIDLPGHGNSHGTCPLSLQQTVDQLLKQLPPVAHYLGWSLGGSVLMQLADMAPERVRSMTLLTANPCFVQKEDWQTAMHKKVLLQFAEALQQDYRKTLLQFIALQTLSSERSKASLRQLRDVLFSRGEPETRALQQGLDILLQADLRDKLLNSGLPILVILGERDQLVPASVADFFRTITDNRRVKVIPAAGHVPFVSHQSETLAEVKGFLENV